MVDRMQLTPGRFNEAVVRRRRRAPIRGIAVQIESGASFNEAVDPKTGAEREKMRGGW